MYGPERSATLALVSAVDAYEFSAIKKDNITAQDMTGDAAAPADTVEYKPMFHEWATVQPGMLCVARKKKTAVFRQYVAAETAVPVIGCAACLPKEDEKNYFFAGVARSKSVRTPDDGIGPNVDEFFTVSIGGMATLLNTSGGPIYPGDLLEWTFATAKMDKGVRAKAGPRRIAVQVASVSSPKLIGRALSFAKSGETFDLVRAARARRFAHASPAPPPDRPRSALARRTADQAVGERTVTFVKSKSDSCIFKACPLSRSTWLPNSTQSPMFDPGSPSNSEPPPAPAAQTHSAQQLRQHPLWDIASGRAKPMNPPAAGRGRGRGRGAPPPPDPDAGARYERISLLAVELQQAATGDGADSALASSDDEDEEPKRKRKSELSDEEEPYDYEEDEEQQGERPETQESDEEFKKPEPRPPKNNGKAKAKTTDAEDFMASAAFGEAGPNLFGDESDTASVASRTSSKRKRDASKNAFPVRGVHCVGCALSNRIGPVERFVNSNVGRMAEVALWKMSALVWKLEVMEPAKMEGADVVPWKWRDIAAHFRLHTTNPVVGRTAMINSLTAMRCQVEQRLVRVENGERELDKQSADLVLKIVAAESRERSLLASSLPGAGRGRGGQRPAGED